jgi:MFS family permease
MMTGAGAMVAALLLLSLTTALNGLSWVMLLITWAIMGLGYSAVLTPSGRLLRRSAHAEDRPAVFAAQFALSHACWLITYPLAGWLMAWFGLQPALLVLAALAALGMVMALRLWPVGDPVEV